MGDSRAYHVDADGVTCVTTDHSVVELMVQRGELTPEEAKSHPSKNIITRAVGTSPQVFSDVFRVELHRGDCLLLCSDGLTDMARDEEIAAVLADCPPAAAAEELVHLALQHGGTDNVSVLLLEVKA